MSLYLDLLQNLDEADRKRVYERLWLEFTIAGRCIAQSAHGEVEQRDALKWLNEIQHRVWGAHADPSNPDILLSLIRSHVEDAPILKGYVGTAFKRAFDAIE